MCCGLPVTVALSSLASLVSGVNGLDWTSKVDGVGDVVDGAVVGLAVLCWRADGAGGITADSFFGWGVASSSSVSKYCMRACGVSN